MIGYNVYRGVHSGGPYQKINSALETATTYIDDNVTAGSTYFYVVTAVDDKSESGYSTEVPAAVPYP
ncbi:MAG: fibronectin type III domain-containing protein [Terriglobales bacterium]